MIKIIRVEGINAEEVIFLNTCIQSKSSIEESENLATNMSVSGFFMGVHSLVG